MDKTLLLLILVLVLLLVNLGVSAASLYKLNKEKFDFNFDNATPLNFSILKQGAFEGKGQEQPEISQGAFEGKDFTPEKSFVRGFNNPMLGEGQEQPEISQGAFGGKNLTPDDFIGGFNKRTLADREQPVISDIMT